MILLERHLIRISSHVSYIICIYSAIPVCKVYIYIYANCIPWLTLFSLTDPTLKWYPLICLLLPRGGANGNGGPARAAKGKAKSKAKAKAAAGRVTEEKTKTTEDVKVEIGFILNFDRFNKYIL